MPVWLRPWIVPAALLIGVFAAAGFQHAGPIASVIIYAVLVLLVAMLLIRLRLDHLKRNPPEPELSNEPFWRRFRGPR
jgi:hypothetical protein